MTSGPRHFRRLLVANVANNAGDGIVMVIAPLLAWQLAVDPLVIASAASAAMLPWLFFSIPAGTIVDRASSRLVLMLASGVRALVAVAVAVLVVTSTLTIPLLLCAVVVFGMGETLADVAVRSATPRFVETQELPSANARLETGELVVQRFVAQPAASMLFGVGAVLPVVLNALAFSVAAVSAWAIPREEARRCSGGAGHRIGGLLAGSRFIVKHPALRVLGAFGLVTTFSFSMAWGSYATRLLEGLELPEEWYGPFLLTQGLGGLLGSAIAVPVARRFGAARTFLFASVAVALGIAAMALPALILVGVGFAVSSCGLLVAAVHGMTIRQRLVPSHLLGRVHGTWRMLMWGTMPLGALVGGALARLDLALPFVAGGGAYLLATAAFARQIVRAVRDEAPAPLQASRDDVSPATRA